MNPRACLPGKIKCLPRVKLTFESNIFTVEMYIDSSELDEESGAAQSV